MWCALKAPLLLGHNLMTQTPSTLDVVTNAAALAVNQDALGVPARRVHVATPLNNSLMAYAPPVAVIALINASGSPGARTSPRLWTFTANATATGPPFSQLLVAPCNASDVYQQWDRGGGALRNLGAGTCLDASARGNPDPGRLAACAAPPTVAQSWALQNGTGHMVSAGGLCLDLFGFVGPDVRIDGACKPSGGGQDGNEVWTPLPGGLIATNSTRAPGKCLVAASGAVVGTLSAYDPASGDWCLVDNGSEGSTFGLACTPGTAPTSSAFWTVTTGSPAGQTQFVGLHRTGLTYNNAPGASGPWPHTRYASGGSPGSSVAWAGTAVPGQASPLCLVSGAGIIDDDLIGDAHPSTGGLWCLDLTSPGVLETWVGPLAGGRFVAVLFNRSPGTDTILLPWSALNASSTERFVVFDVWENATIGTFSDDYSATVRAEALALLVLSPAP